MSELNKNINVILHFSLIEMVKSSVIIKVT